MSERYFPKPTITDLTLSGSVVGSTTSSFDNISLLRFGDSINLESSSLEPNAMIVDVLGGGFPYTGSAVISGSLEVTGSTNLEYLTASGIVYPISDGDEKQFITTNGDGNLSFDWADRINIDVKNTSGVSLKIGTPVYINGFQGASVFQIAPTSASVVSTMPAVGVLDQDLAPNQQGYATLLGALRGYNTSLCNINDSLYVGEGILTKDRPTGSALIQKIARVGKIANNGEITVLGAGRSNDIPNLQPGYVWVGDSTWNAVATPTSSFNENPFPYTGSAVISGSLEVIGDITGSEALLNSIVPSEGSVRIGYQAGQNVNSNAEVAIGYQALATHTGYSGIAIGYQAAKNMTQPGDIVHIGYAAGTNAGTSGNTIFIGRDTGYNRGNSNNAIALGTRAMRDGSGNSIGIGNNALSRTTGDGNIAIGNQAGGLYNNTRTISDSVMIGDYAGRDNNGSKNILIGGGAGQSGANFTNSIAIGYEAAHNQSGSNNVVLGYQAGYNLTGSNQLVIANNSSSALITGDFANNTLDILGSVSASTYYGDGSNLTNLSIPSTYLNTEAFTTETISSNFNFNTSQNIATISTSSEGAIIEYRLSNLESGSRNGVFTYSHNNGTNLEYKDIIYATSSIGGNPTISASIVNNQVSIDIENAGGFNFSGFAKKFSVLNTSVPLANPNLPTPLLDNYSGAFVAYSVRKLKASYSGYCMRIRRASDNSETDIGFDVNYGLDTNAIISHCGSNVGYVTVWYDQSGNNYHMSQSNASTQPMIYNGTTIETEGNNNKPIIRALSTKTYFDAAIPSTTLSSVDIFTSAHSSYSTTMMMHGDSGFGKRIYTSQTSNTTTDGTSAGVGSPTQYINGIVTSSFTRGEVYTQFLDLTLANLMGCNFGTQTSIRLGTNDNFWRFFDLQEFILYNSDQSSNRENINLDMNSYYSAYYEGLAVDYPPFMAYSLRKLTTEYTGAAIKVRRDSDNTEQDIGFNNDGTLNTNNLTSFVGASNNGYVTTWYDQSGNSHNATQTTSNYQPLIYHSSSGYLGKLDLETNNEGQLNIYPRPIGTGSVAVFVIADLNAIGAGELVGTRHTGPFNNSLGWGLTSYGGGIYWSCVQNVRNVTDVNTQAQANTKFLTIGLRNETSNQIYYQNGLPSTSTVTNSVTDYGTNQQFNIGANSNFGNVSNTLNGNIYEVLIYNTDEINNVSSIKNLINEEYNLWI